MYFTNRENTDLEQNRVSEAKLLFSYIQTYKNNIQNLHTRSGGGESEFINKVYKDLTAMSDSLIRIENRYISDENSLIVMKLIVSDLKSLNTRIKSYLEEIEIQKSLQLIQKKEKYIVLSRHIASVLEEMIDSISAPLLKKNTLNEKEREIVKSLILIREEKNKIKNFYILDFKTQKDMKIYLKGIIQNIRKEMRYIKSKMN